MKTFLRIAVATLGMATLALGADKPPVTAQARVDRTALWVGDRVHYVIEVRCRPGVDIVAADLAADRLPLIGLEVVSSEVDRQVDEHGVRYRADHVLTTYSFDASPAIGPLALRYRPLQAGAPEAPDAEVSLPPVSLALRSALPEALDQARLRDEGVIQPLPLVVRLAGPLGWSLLALSALPILSSTAVAIRRATARARSRAAKAPGETLSQELAALRALDSASDTERRRAYPRLDALLRRRATEILGLDAFALTAAELARSGRASGHSVPEGLDEVLEDCEIARFGREASLPSAARFALGLEAAGQLLEAR